MAASQPPRRRERAHAPKYQEIYEYLRGRIEDGALPFRSFLPSENQLSADFNTTRPTVRKALQYLGSQGYVQPIHGRGIQVIYRPRTTSRFFLSGIESLAEAGGRMGTEVRTVLLHSAVETIPEPAARASGLSAGTEVLYLRRLRLLDGRPAIIDHNRFLREVVPEIPREAAETSVYAYLEDELGVYITTASRMVTIEAADELDRRHLDLGGLDCVGVMESLGFDASGVPFEYTRSHHVPATFGFVSAAQRLPSHR
ncbi:UTRA domain-containing protein [Actinomyces sp.]|uniref:UTRA domain-containing protein n=1 Tax=Actinomyces sp. TaxID=29317 RepID=UPI0026DC3D99|nr:UTRA domain-containing protein [Actinomyces sp.]MDO4899151.1 UTRA domain-containing protein [Actinomyces sp.]